MAGLLKLVCCRASCALIDSILCIIGPSDSPINLCSKNLQLGKLFTASVFTKSLKQLQPSPALQFSGCSPARQVSHSVTVVTSKTYFLRRCRDIKQTIYRCVRHKFKSFQFQPSFPDSVPGRAISSLARLLLFVPIVF